MQSEPQIGDIVLYHLEDGDVCPAIVVKVLSSTSLLLCAFVIGGVVCFRKPKERGAGPEQWEMRQ